MSCSPKQLAANRRNAQKSTGPRTPQGKAISSRNATRHGLYARTMVLESTHLKERREDYDHLVDGLMADFQPADDTQKSLVRRIADCFWLQRRAAVAETRFIEQLLPRMEPGRSLSVELSRTSFNRDLARYEWSIECELFRALRRLNELQTPAEPPETGLSPCTDHEISYNEPTSSGPPS